tara:strand:- start:411 stop:680 length:270 start_codon:yes stop_codon:yes gene_type:complete
MADKKVKLKSGKEVILLEMSVDDIDVCQDTTSIIFDKDGNQVLKGINAARTMWLRKGVKKSDDKFIKSLSEEEKNELSLLVREHQSLGE